MRLPLAIILLMLLLPGGSHASAQRISGHSSGVPNQLPGSFVDFMVGVRDTFELPSIAAVLIRRGRVVAAGGFGLANRERGIAAGTDTIYLMASCTKPVVGLALAKAVEQGLVALDRDVNTYLRWKQPLRNPLFPEVAITLRMLAQHYSGIATDSAHDYDTYPKPDPDLALNDFMRSELARKKAWTRIRPGTREHYSNLGAALAGLVIERAAGKPFDRYCREQLFDPLGLSDTRWTYGAYSPAQKRRLARLYDDEGVPYAVYGFGDYPSGLLRTTVHDLTRMLLMLINRGQVEGTAILKPESLALFESVPLFVDVSDDIGEKTFGHTGGEYGINCAFEYSARGDALAYFVNRDLDEPDLEDLHETMFDYWLETIANP